MLQEFAQQVEETAREVVNEVHTALPGEIVSFNAASGMATVKPIGKFATPDGKKLDYPAISEVPVVFPFCQSAGVGLAYPVNPKDSCLIIVSEVELDEWRTGAESEGSLKFDLTNAVAIPGLLEGGGTLISEAQKQQAAVLGAGDNRVIVSDSGVTVDTGATVFKITDTGAELTGNLKVKGTITASETVKAGSIDLKQHTHISSEPGTKSGVAQ